MFSKVRSAMGHRRARERRREPDGTEETESKPGHRAEETTDTDREGSRSERPPGIVNRSTVDTSGRQATAGDVRGEEGGVGPASGYVGYERGPDRAALSARYGMAVRRSEAERLRRLESKHGSDQVGRWADEGMPVDTMGRPRDMRAFRERQAGRPEEVPADIERQNEASRRRNVDRSRESGPAGETGVPDVVRSVVSSRGRSMEETIQREMESKMGGEFGDVQVHTGPEAAAAAESLGARAFTVGNHIAFNRGEYSPDSEEGKRVLAHELTHVRQQAGRAVSLLAKADADRHGAALGDGVHVQPKLEVSSPDDPAEREAERVAERVVRMDDPVEDGERDERERDTDTQRSRVERSGEELSEEAESTVRNAVKSGGKPLPADRRSTLEAKMGADFSDVRVHTGPDADEAARSIHAEAFTVGTDIAFAKGNYAPESTAGRELLAHELTHVVQQGSGAQRAIHLQQQQQKQRPTGESSGADTEQNQGTWTWEIARRNGATSFSGSRTDLEEFDWGYLGVGQHIHSRLERDATLGYNGYINVFDRGEVDSEREMVEVGLEVSSRFSVPESFLNYLPPEWSANSEYEASSAAAGAWNIHESSGGIAPTTATHDHDSVGNPEAIGPLSTKALITKYEATEYSERLKEINIGAQAAINVGGSISHSGGVSASAKGVGVSMSSTLSHDAGVSITKEAEFTVEGRLEQP